MYSISPGYHIRSHDIENRLVPFIRELRVRCALMVPQARTQCFGPLKGLHKLPGQGMSNGSYRSQSSLSKLDKLVFATESGRSMGVTVSHVAALITLQYRLKGPSRRLLLRRDRPP